MANERERQRALAMERIAARKRGKDCMEAAEGSQEQLIAQLKAQEAEHRMRAAQELGKPHLAGRIQNHSVPQCGACHSAHGVPVWCMPWCGVCQCGVCQCAVCHSVLYATVCCMPVCCMPRLNKLYHVVMHETILLCASLLHAVFSWRRNIEYTENLPWTRDNRRTYY